MNNVYEVIVTNLDIQDGYFCNVLFSNLESAKKYAQEKIEGKDNRNITVDFEGNLESFQNKSLNYTVCSGKPAIYYNSHYGNYRCVVFIESRKVYE